MPTLDRTTRHQPKNGALNASDTGPYPAIVPVSAPTGFDWGDAGIGAVASFGLSMLTIGGRLMIAVNPRRRRHPVYR